MMFGSSIRTHQRVADPLRAVGSPTSVRTPRGLSSPRFKEAGEVDTRAPFQSVKAAVSLFGDVSSPKAQLVFKKPKTAEERLLEKETQLQSALEELDKFKEQLKSAETTKAQAQGELEKANRTLQELTSKLEMASESKQAAITAKEAAKNRAIQLEEAAESSKQKVTAAREQYEASAAELILAKQELASTRRHFEAALETKLAALKEAADAQHETKARGERIDDLSKEISTMRETLSQVKLATLHAQEERARTMEDKEACLKSHRTAKAEVEKKILSLKGEGSDSNYSESLEGELEETTKSIRVLQEQLKTVSQSGLQSLRMINLELEGAENTLLEILQDESLLRSSVDSLRLELDLVKRELSQIREKEARSESDAENLRDEPNRSRLGVETVRLVPAGESKQEDAFADMGLTIKQLSSVTENAKREVEELKKSTVELNQEAESALKEAKETEEKLQVALKEAEEAIVEAKLAMHQLHTASSCTADAAHVTNPDSRNKIKLSAEKFESLSRIAEEFEKLAQMKMAAAMAEVEARRASERETVKRLETSLGDIEDTKAATEDALRKAEMAEAAKQAVEAELQKWHQQEQTKEVENSSYGQEESDVSTRL